MVDVFGVVLDAAAGMPTWLLSYRDQSFPTDQELKALFTERGREVSLKKKAFSYGPLGGKRRGEAPAQAVEYLLVGSKAPAAKESPARRETGVATLGARVGSQGWGDVARLAGDAMRA